MRFLAYWSRSVSFRAEFLKVFGDFGEELSGHASGEAQYASENAWQDAAKMTEGDGAIYPPGGIWFENLLRGQIDGQSIEGRLEKPRPALGKIPLF